MTIVEFLEARLDEDEEVARDAAGWDSSGSVRDEGLWRRDGVNSVIDGARRMVVYGDGSAPDDSRAEHIVRHDPARVLRELAAKRAIIAEYVNECWVQDQGHRTAWTEGGQAARETALRLFASTYSDHPEYQAEWAIS
ncbi:DUF6221 family protein [Rhodococcus sp. IEGM 1318]|uniref:DUF6221 family protein n=1 Tax=Rhodococcus sp. IEGM 1318 TaxID=3082226 RepID=UPI002954B675|nr:DUF6221 family protein [Rhodococcus sp. IEGM 1318]MDV8005031.1 DUF6221 family protein [Rhodococcus sp. IEGM 1318]